MQPEGFAAWSADEIEHAMDQLQDENAGRAAVRPEDHNLPTRFNGPAHLAEDLHDLILAEMFDDAEIVSAIEAGICHVAKMQDVAVTNSLRARVVATVGFECRH